MTAVEEPQRSRAAGGCVLVVLAGTVGAVVFAVSAEAGILATVGAATAAVWWAVSRPVSDSSATPPPPPSPPSGDVYAGESTEVERVQKGPGEGLSIIYPVRVEVTEP